MLVSWGIVPYRFDPHTSLLPSREIMGNPSKSAEYVICLRLVPSRLMVNRSNSRRFGSWWLLVKITVLPLG